MKNKILTSLATLFAVVGLSTGSAFAWTYGLTGAGSCQPDGSYKIIWHVDNTTENEALHITASSQTAVIPVGADIAANSTQDFSQTVSGTVPASFSLHLTGNFPSDQTLRDRDATVTLETACGQPGRGGGECTDSSTNHMDQDEDRQQSNDEHQDADHNDAACGEQEETTTTPTGGRGGGETSTPTVTTTSSVTTTAPTPVTGGRGAGVQVAAPTGGVSAGEGGASTSLNVASAFGLLSSVSVAGLGLRRLSKQV